MISRKHIVQTASLLLLLAILPIGSWYYLQEGYRYRKALLDDLQQLGQIPDLAVPNAQDSLVRLHDFRGKVLVLGMLKPEDEASFKVLRSVGQQFAESGYTHILLMSEDADQARQWQAQLINTSGETLFTLLSMHTASAQKLPDALPQGMQWGMVALADTSLTIRRLYHLNQPEDQKRLVEHLAIVIPPKRSPKPEVKRTVEK